MLKFRSMVRRPKETSTSAGSSTRVPARFQIRDDPRVTKCGRWMRKYSLDELPSSWNVLTGEMSLNSARRPLPREVEGHEKFTNRRLLDQPE